MKILFRHQKFQLDAAKSVCDVFNGQPYLTPSYMMDRGFNNKNAQFHGQQTLMDIDKDHFTGFNNQRIVPELNDNIILENIQKIQRKYLIEPSQKLEGKYNLTIEMETGVGKTYTYIKTMYELNKRYGWSKFIVVVPSVAIREGVYKSFQITQDHFAEEYNKKIRFFIYSSAQLTEIDRFASDSGINVMIINSQAFNAKGKDARRIYMKLDEFRSRKPIDIIAKTNPILIIDEPQSVEGTATKERLTDFNPMITLRYSATHKKDSIYNMIYRLDAMEAYNKKLVKKISVKGITVSGSTATEGYLYLESINLSKDKAPTANLQFDIKGSNGTRKVTRKVTQGYNLYDNSGELAEYKNGYTVISIDGRDNSVTFMNGVKIFAGDVLGAVSEEQIRRIQIRETILTHLESERRLFYKGIKVLSLFFIDEVAKYRQYDKNGNALNGDYANVFEEEYKDILNDWQIGLGEDDYLKYINSLPVTKTHQGYFSIDKSKGNRFVESKLGDKREKTSDDSDAYDLIMKDKERLLDHKEAVRFIFSHSALREGWDNPNVFQICTLKQSGSEVRKRQEVGRGLRLCVNSIGERMDINSLGEDVHNVNVLTVIANESYDTFAKGLQEEIAEAVADRPRVITADLFKNKVIKDNNGAEQVVDADMAQTIYEGLIVNGYVKKGILTEKYYEDKKNGCIEISDDVADCKESVIEIINTIYDAKAMQFDDARSNNVELKLDRDKLNQKEFQDLWKRINSKTAYIVDFDTNELIRNSIQALNKDLNVSKIFIRVESGTMTDIKSKEDLMNGTSFVREKSEYDATKVAANNSVKYDLVGKIVDDTGLTRGTVVEILKGINKQVFEQFKDNPEEFIIKASNIINEQKATAIIQHITYNKLETAYDTSIFTDPTMKGRLGINAKVAQKHLYDHILYDSTNEKAFADKLDISNEVAVYAKLPKGFYITTPVGRYNPDWAIAFHEDKVKHIYFVAETKGSLSSMQLRTIEDAKIQCAREHFKAISTDQVKYDVVDSYDTLMNKVMR
jgi:type III restriction enzyme